MTEELRLAAVLVGLYGDTGDLPLLLEVRETDFDTACGLGGIPEPGARADELRQWARELDESMFGTDPADELVSIWTDLARDQGMTEPARVTLIRELDDIVMDQSRLRCPWAPRTLAMAPLSGLAGTSRNLATFPRRCAPSACMPLFRRRHGIVPRPGAPSPAWSGRRAGCRRR